MATDEPNHRTYVEALLGDWFRTQSEPCTFRMGRPNRPTHEAQFTLVWGYCCHVHMVARAYLAAVDAAPAIAASPPARMIYQTALTAHWIAQSPEGYRGLGNEEIRQRSQLVTTLTKTSVNEVFRASAAQINHADLNDRIESESDTAARNFEQLCNDLQPGGAEDAYTIHRVMSMESHPSVVIADQWLEAPTDEDGPPKLRSVPR